MLDLDQIRADIPIVQQRIHFNNAGMSLMAQPVFDCMVGYLAEEQTIGGYEVAITRAADTANFYQQAASMLSCEPAEVAFFEGATRAWQAFFYSLRFAPGDRIITTQIDYGSNFVGFIQQRNRLGVEIDVIDYDENGDIDFASMENLITDRTRLISLSHIPTANGLINPAARVGQIAKSAGIPFLLDACQSMGQVEVDVKKIGCTAMSATGRKYLRGPRGTGLLYVDGDFLKTVEPACLDQHGVELLDKDTFEIAATARRFENFEAGFASRIALGKAIEYANNIGMSEIASRVKMLGEYCRQQLAAIPGLTCHDTGKDKGGIVMFSVEGEAPEQIRDKLAKHGVSVWVSSGPGGLVDFQRRGLDQLLRASLHYFNTEQEIDRMISLLRQGANG